MKEKDFDIKVAFKLRKLATDYEIGYSIDEVIPTDDTADKLFNAAIELLVDVGVYNKDTQRIINFTREEVVEIAKTRLHEITIGEGNDEVVVKERNHESTFPPVIVTGPVGGPISEELYAPCHQSFAQEPTCQGLICGSLLSAQGLENIAGKPNELIVTKREVEYLKQVCRDVGKLGLYLSVVPVSGVTPDAIINAYTTSHISPSRAQVAIQFYPELKTHWGHFKLALFCKDYGIHPWTDTVATIGALCRNPVEASISQIAGILSTFALNGGSSAAVWSTGVNGLCTTRKNLWVNCATNKALERNVGNPVYLLGYASAGPCTEMLFYETAAYTIAYTACGGELIWGGSSCNGVIPNRYAGLQGRMVGETARAVCAIGREKANEMINQLYALYEGDLPNAPLGQTFDECYNLKTIQPTNEYLSLYNRVKEKLHHEMGINYAY